MYVSRNSRNYDLLIPDYGFRNPKNSYSVYRNYHEHNPLLRFTCLLISVKNDSGL